MDDVQVIKLRYVLGEKPSDIAKDLKLRPYTVHKVLQPIKNTIRKMYKRGEL